MQPLRGALGPIGDRFFAINGFSGAVFIADDGALNWGFRGLTDDKGGLVTFGVVTHGKDPAPTGAGFFPLQIVVADLNGNASGSVQLSLGMKVGWSGETVHDGLVMDAYAYDNAANGPSGYSQPITVTIQVLHPPPSVDLRAGCGPVLDQGSLGSCTGHAFADALAFLEVRDGLPPTKFSPLYIYYNERFREGTVGFDAGASLSDGVKSLTKGDTSDGACYESTWPYDVAKFAVLPPSEAYLEGHQHEILVAESFQPVNSAYQLADMKDCLASGFPFVFGFSVFESFESASVASTGVVPMPAPGEKIIGGHAVLCVGYDDASQRFTCQNSWGQSWGASGFFTIPYAFMGASWPAYTSDYWTLRKGELMLT
jgi:hypothetical protein